MKKSRCTRRAPRLADDRFAADLFAALPERTTTHVPLYGASAECHDRVVGRSGAHTEVQRAIAVLEKLLCRQRIVINTVVVPENLGELGALAAWARDRGLAFRAQTPYPSSEAPSDRFHHVAVRYSDLARRALGGEPPVSVAGVPPCIGFRVAGELGLSLKQALPLTAPRPALPGREYARGQYTHRALPVQNSAFLAAAVACPHLEECALATICAGELLRSYVDRFGLDELSPVSVADVVRAIEAPRERPGAW